MRLTRVVPSGTDELRQAVLGDIESLLAGGRVIATGVLLPGGTTIDLLADERERLVLALFCLEANPEAIERAADAWAWAVASLPAVRALAPGRGLDLSREPRVMIVADRADEQALRLAASLSRPDVDLFEARLVRAGDQLGALVQRISLPARPAVPTASEVESALAEFPPGESRSLLRRILEEVRDIRVHGEEFHIVAAGATVDLTHGGRLVGSIVGPAPGLEVRRLEGSPVRRVTNDDDCREAVSFLVAAARPDSPVREPFPAHVTPGISAMDATGGMGTRRAAGMMAALSAEEMAEFQKVASRPEPPAESPSLSPESLGMKRIQARFTEN